MSESTDASRLARAYARIVVGLRWLIPPVWAAAAVLAVLLVPGLGSVPTAALDEIVPPDAPALDAADVATEKFGSPLTSDTAVVYRDPAGLSDETLERAGGGALGTAERDRGPILLAAPAVNLPAPHADWRERGTTVIAYLFFSPEANLVERNDAAERYAEQYGPAAGQGGPGAVGVTGAGPARLSQSDHIESTLPLIEGASVLVVALLVGLYFRSITAPLATLFAAGIAFLLAERAAAWAAERASLTVPQEIGPLLVVLLVGLTTDYAVFFLAATRRHLDSGLERVDAARAATAEVAPIVATAGLIVAAGTASLLAGRLEFFRVFGPGLALTALVTLVVSVTLIPAIAGIGGQRLFGGRRGQRPAAEPDAPTTNGAIADGNDRGAAIERLRLQTGRPLGAFRAVRALARAEGLSTARVLLARLLAARPIAFVLVVVTVAGLGFAAARATNADLGPGFITALPADSEVRLASDQAQRGFAPGIVAPTEVIVTGDGVGGDEAALARFEDLLAGEPGVAAVLGPEEQPAAPAPRVAISEDGSAARYAVVLDREPLTAAAIDVVRVLEERIPGLAREAGLGSADVYVGGQTAIAGQTVRFVVSDLWRIGAVTLLVNLILLALFLRALVAPVLLLAASVLSFGAALGITTVVFEDILGYGELTYYVPFAAAVLLIALGSDYNVFIAGRIWHEAQRRRLQEAMAIAAPTASKSILVAGVTLALTFALLALVPVRPFREFAFLLALGVILDAVVVRSVLVPGLISLAGRWAFWPGRPIVRVEREQFLAALIERAGIEPGQGGGAALATATTLGERISAAHARVLAARLPADVGEAMLSSDTRPETFSAREFVERVAQREQVSDAAARARIHGFSAALADATGDGELERLRAGLPPEYDDLLRR